MSKQLAMDDIRTKLAVTITDVTVRCEDCDNWLLTYTRYLEITETHARRLWLKSLLGLPLEIVAVHLPFIAARVIQADKKERDFPTYDPHRVNPPTGTVTIDCREVELQRISASFAKSRLP